MSNDVMCITNDEEEVFLPSRVSKFSHTRAQGSVTPATSGSGGSSSSGAPKRMRLSDDTDEDLPLTGKDIPTIVKAVVDTISSKDTRDRTSDDFSAGLDTYACVNLYIYTVKLLIYGLWLLCIARPPGPCLFGCPLASGGVPVSSRVACTFNSQFP